MVYLLLRESAARLITDGPGALVKRWPHRTNVRFGVSIAPAAEVADKTPLLPGRQPGGENDAVLDDSLLA
jgi:hypothetical protein